MKMTFANGTTYNMYTRVITANINENSRAETMKKNEQEEKTARSRCRYVI